MIRLFAGIFRASVRMRSSHMGRMPRVDRRVWMVAAIVVAGPPGLAGGARAQVRLPDLDNRLVDTFQVPADPKAIVFVFLSVDCPISNRYAPEVRRLYDTFAKGGVSFLLIYPNHAESSEAIR